MTDPYREEATRRHEALLADERTLLVRAGKVMVYAGIVGLIAVLVGLKAASTEDVVVLLRSTVLPGLFSALTLQAGWCSRVFLVAGATTTRSKQPCAAWVWSTRSKAWSC
jgi:hypothetical protein